MKEQRQSETLYDKLRRDWVDVFTTSVKITKDGTCTPGSQQNVISSPPSDQAVRMGWALPKPRAGSSGVKRTLNRCPAICGKQQMSKTIGSLIEKNGSQKAKCKVFFPTLYRVEEGSKNRTEMDLNSRNLLRKEEEADRQYLIEEVTQELRPQHPLSYNVFNLCKCARENKLIQFNIPMLKQILRHFEIPFKSRDKKRDLAVQLMSFSQECDCQS